MDWGLIIKGLGLTSAVLLIIVFILGFFRINIPNRVKLHKTLAIVLLCTALIHGGIVIYMTLKG
ncbi:MAG: hypothetical protein CVV21_01225 [Candidatus Goldiibacteriota bacterium HGW-Goldbacteria-1]|jgi:hypothetical protein|nr:MAG: hypothetical protein CVV21_01225 [Candidatus Goldiibacteriota bacterium HGW-Goldbacteria-1]